MEMLVESQNNQARTDNSAAQNVKLLNRKNKINIIYIVCVSVCKHAYDGLCVCMLTMVCVCVHVHMMVCACMYDSVCACVLWCVCI